MTPPHVPKGWALIRGGPIIACQLFWIPPELHRTATPEVITSLLVNALRTATRRITGNGAIRD